MEKLFSEVKLCSGRQSKIVAIEYFIKKTRTVKQWLTGVLVSGRLFVILVNFTME